MAYIGINPNQDLAQRFTEVFTGNGVQTQFTLPIAPGSTNAVDVSVGGVDQIGGVNFSVSGTTLTFLTGAPENGQLIKVLFTAEINTGDYSRTRNTRKTASFIATAGQTVFAIPGGYDPGQIDVFLNGVKLTLGVDFVGTSGTVVTLNDPASAGDEVDTIAYGVFYVSGSVNKAGDTMTGPLVVPAGATGNQVPRFSDVQTAITSSFQSVSSINGGQLAGMRNKIINGKMEIAQRGTSFAAIANAAYSLDRWQWEQATSAQSTVTQNSDVPSSNEFQNSLRVTVTTADTSIAAGDYAALGQRIEGFNVRDLIGRTFTLSFWVRSSKTGIHCVSFRNSGFDRSFVVEYTISAAGTWEYKTVTISGGLITAGANWNWTTGVGVIINWALAAGSTFQTTAGAWQTGNFLATANQVNCLDTIDNIFAITGVQLEVGEVATPFEHRSYGTELALCQRYFEAGTLYGWGTATGAAQHRVAAIRYLVSKRVVPTVGFASLVYSNSSAASLEGVDELSVS